MSSYCPTCKRLQTMPRNFEYESSKVDHICQCNFTGSSSKMEIVGASRIFLRFEKNRRLQYTQYCRTHNLLQVPIAELAERWTELPQVSDESRSFFRVHTGYFSNIPKCIKAEFIASWACSQSSVVSSSQR
ncbi:hypothetical protein TNCV_5072541 [Trichonephila clavipes]|nr:hypothetical protein TNCV_5072541 [Trichonephila clavipes]